MLERRFPGCLILAGISLFMSNIVTGVLEGWVRSKPNHNSVQPYMYSLAMYGYLESLRRYLPVFDAC
jgi:hypothetical protein